MAGYVVDGYWVAGYAVGDGAADTHDYGPANTHVLRESDLKRKLDELRGIKRKLPEATPPEVIDALDEAIEAVEERPDVPVSQTLISALESVLSPAQIEFLEAPKPEFSFLAELVKPTYFESPEEEHELLMRVADEDERVLKPLVKQAEKLLEKIGRK